MADGARDAEATRLLGGAVLAVLVSLADIAPLLWLIEARPLPLWAHVPVTALALAVEGLAAMAAGVLLVEWRIRRGLRF